MDAPTPPQKKLTKKEQKALAFRQGKKNAKRSLNEDDAVPEEEDLAAVEAAGGEKSSKKRKRDKDDKEGGKEAEKDGEGKEAAGEAAVDEEPKKKKRQRGKTPAQRAREAREKQQGVDGPAGADGAHRLLLFIGPFLLSSLASLGRIILTISRVFFRRKPPLQGHRRGDPGSLRSLWYVSSALPPFLRLHQPSSFSLLFFD